MTIHGSLFTEFKEKETQDPFSLQNKKLLRIDMRYGEVHGQGRLDGGLPGGCALHEAEQRAGADVQGSGHRRGCLDDDLLGERRALRRR
jgi:hypothetical protein